MLYQNHTIHKIEHDISDPIGLIQIKPLVNINTLINKRKRIYVAYLI